MILYADDSSVIVTAPNHMDLIDQANLVFHNINTWFQNNLLLLNFDKTLFTNFFTNQSIKRMGIIQYNNMSLTNAPLIKFLGLMIDNNLTWNHQVDLILRRLSSSCYAFNYIKYTLSIDTLKLIYFAHVQSIMSYGIIFWGTSTKASKIFILQKKNPSNHF